jgi:hypothetical protein
VHFFVAKNASVHKFARYREKRGKKEKKFPFSLLSPVIFYYFVKEDFFCSLFENRMVETNYFFNTDQIKSDFEEMRNLNFNLFVAKNASVHKFTTYKKKRGKTFFFFSLFFHEREFFIRK